MPRVKNPLEYYIKAEVFGQPNTGKSVFAYSICKLKPLLPTKNKIVVFSNEATFADTLKLFSKEEVAMFDIRQHKSLEEFEGDWAEFVSEFKLESTYDQNGRRYTDVETVRNQIHAIIIDEGEFLYREGYVARHAHSLNKKAIDFQPKDYGVPRSWFVTQINRMAMLPCHFILCSKVAAEYESFRNERRDGELGALQFRKTGEDKYRLPENILYMPNLSIHTFCHETPVKGDDGKQVLDELGRPTIKEEFYGEARKQKANREEPFIIRNPTINKCLLKLNAIRKKVKIV